ncbi:MAG: carboxypeptidase-like regulatory domain-containing protein [Acidobacteriia bacterium]|nr:carboxypeptidase-like regulatory domain-containing protein [Terriglobia bacterium]
MRWFPLALLLGAFLADAQNTPLPAANTDSGQKVRIEGTILSLNGDLVRKATVRLQGTGGQPGQPTSYIETTDSAGKFIFDDVAPGRYTLSAEKPGFVTARYGARPNGLGGTPLDLTGRTEMKDLQVKLTPQGVIAGRVVDKDGDPVVSVQVQAMRFAYTGGRKQLQPAGGTTTNDLGEYRLISLAPGRYYISATDNRRAIQGFIQERPGRAGTVPEGNITTFYPNGADVSAAVAVDVAAGAEMRGTDIRLLQGKVYTVRGKTVNASGAPPSGFLQLIRKDSGGNLPAILNGGGSSQVRPDGTFEFRGILQGTYVLQLAQVNSVNGNPAADLTGRMEVTVGDSDIDNLELPLVPHPEIMGTVTLEDGDIASLVKPAQKTPGVAAAGNAVRPQPGRLALTLFQTENGFGIAVTAQVKEDGTFQFSSVGLGRYALNVNSLPQGTYLKSARFAGQDAIKGFIDTTSGTGGTLELVLSSKSADIAGSVQNDKGEAQSGVMVTLWPKIPDSNPIGGVRPAMTDPSGGFQFKGLAPGDYYVAAWEDLDLGLVQSVDFLSHFTSEATAVTLSESSHESRDVKLVPADKIASEVAKLQ